MALAKRVWLVEWGVGGPCSDVAILKRLRLGNDVATRSASANHIHIINSQSRYALSINTLA